MTRPAEALLDRIVHHRIALGRYSSHVMRQVLATLRPMEQRIVDRIKLAEPGYSAARLDRLLSELCTVMDMGYSVLRQRLSGDLDQLAVQEAAWAAKAVSSTGARLVLEDLPTQTQIVTAVTSRPFQGVLLREALDDLGANAQRRVRATVRQGFIEGRSPADIARTLRGTKAARYLDGDLQTSRRGAELLVRTAITHTSSAAASETYKSFGDLVTGVRWVAILDTRTTLICAGLNGRVFPVDSGKRPPAHWGCRSTVVPEIAGIEGAQIPDYGAWLKRQSTDQQNDILGPARARLWRAGKVQIDGFTDRRGKVLTLDELAYH